MLKKEEIEIIVEQVYMDILNRPADKKGLNNWTSIMMDENNPINTKEELIAAFKLSDEYWEVLGGWNTNNGGLGVQFCRMFEQAFACAAAHTDEIAALVEATVLGLTQSPRQARAMANGVRMRMVVAVVCARRCAVCRSIRRRR